MEELSAALGITVEAVTGPWSTQLPKPPPPYPPPSSQRSPPPVAGIQDGSSGLSSNSGGGSTGIIIGIVLAVVGVIGLWCACRVLGSNSRGTAKLLKHEGTSGPMWTSNGASDERQASV